MATTSPDNLRTPNPTDPYNLVADLAILASDTQEALVKRANQYVGTSAQRTAFTSAVEGVHWQDTNGSKRNFVWKSGAWEEEYPAPRIASGTILVPGSSSTVTLTFPSGRFTAAPTVILNPITGDTGHNAYATSASATSVTINYSRPSNTNIIWLAIQET